MAPPRIYLTGRVAIEQAATLVDERQLAGRQGRLAFVYLLLNRNTTVTRDELVDVIWPEHPPAGVDVALHAIVSKLRAAFRNAGISGADIELRMKCFAVRLPADVRIDVEDAAHAVDESEGGMRVGDHSRARGHAMVAVTILRRPLLPDEHAEWLDGWRTKLRGWLGRALESLSTLSAQCGEPMLAVQYASELVELEPFRETGYRQLMRAHAQMGNRAEALRVFGRCRELLREELGVSPSPQTEAIYLQILKAEHA